MSLPDPDTLSALPAKSVRGAFFRALLPAFAGDLQKYRMMNLEGLMFPRQFRLGLRHSTFPPLADSITDIS